MYNMIIGGLFLVIGAVAGIAGITLIVTAMLEHSASSVPSIRETTPTRTNMILQSKDFGSNQATSRAAATSGICSGKR